ncbi:uncharacterized protein LOC130816113 isoform X2 [Amaranthus tricolor]|uniref:uncharacterized protein LOC130816113 isoform X2 n=1 Tax=Amaranthus tricolor TaxID=29722 RepID=UPI00258FF703|nr:uncharacterized protein LOC130816113 isoform X2 [Amaranthus tricolor]
MSTKGIRSKVKMRGFMCRHSPVMCMSDDIKSVIVPGKSNYGRTSSSMLSVHHHHCHGRIRVNNNNNNHLIKYSKLVNDDKEMEVLLPLGGRDHDEGDDDHRLSVSQQKQKQKQKKHQVLEVTSRAASTHIFQGCNGSGQGDDEAAQDHPREHSQSQCKI